MSETSLGGLKIVDFSRVLAGPLATMVLADLGAEVTKVERPGKGDDTRSWGPPYDAEGRATYFQSVNRNKRSVALDLRSDHGRNEARRLAADADAVVENFRPGVMERLGLGFEDLSADNPGLVYCSITGFGDGKGAALPGYDLLVQAMGGLMSITGEPEGEPQKVGVALVDVVCGLFAASGVLAALRYRDRSGTGQRVQVDLLSSLLASLVNQATAFTQAGVVPTRMGNSHPSIAPYDLFSAADGELVLAVGNDQQFRSLCGVLGIQEVADDSRFAENPARVENRAELRRLLEDALANRNAGDWVSDLNAEGIPAGRVNDIAGAFEFAQGLGLEAVIEVPDGKGGVTRLPRNPLRLSATPVRYRNAPPDLPG